MPEAEVQMSKRSLLTTLGGLFAAVMIAPLLPRIALAGHESKVKEMIEKGDHAGLAEYYKKEAEDAKHKADGMKEMASDYLKKYPKNTYAKHCEKMEERYRAEAKDLEALAEQHSKATKGGK
jgi:DNA repair photolyase